MLLEIMLCWISSYVFFLEVNMIFLILTDSVYVIDCIILMQIFSQSVFFIFYIFTVKVY